MVKRWCVLGLVLFLVACGSGGGGNERPDPPSASKSAAELQVADQREIEVEGGRILSLSPDGGWLAVEKSKSICIYSTDSLAEQVCIPWEGGGLDWHSFTWSPDGKQIAFTENFPHFFFDSDLWLMEAESGALNNLTDDGIDRFQFGDEEMEKARIDLAPTWSPDGKTLLFARSTWSGGDWQGTTLYKIPAQGGDPKEVLTASDEEPAAVWYSLMWSRDGEKILYTVLGMEPDAPHNGVWMAEADGENPEHVLGTSDPDLGPPFLLDLSAEGDKALVVYYWALGQYGAEPNTSFVALLDLETGQVEPLKQAQGEEPEFVSLGQAVFSPDGSKILYVYRDFEPRWHLVVRDVVGGREKVLLSTEEPIGIHREFSLGLDWADDDTIFVSRVLGREGGLLLSLAAE